MKLNHVFIFVALCMIFVGCESDIPIPINENQYSDVRFRTPEHFPAPVYQPESTLDNRDAFILGRKLFYDPILSRDNSISCGSCHQQFAAFAHLDHTVSHGIDNKLGTRNSPPLFNLAWQTSFMWDGGINHMEVQPLAPIENPVEMDEKLANVITKLKSNSNYPALFKYAFGNDSINSQRLFKSIAYFMSVLISDNAKYDKIQRGEPGYTFTASEKQGYTIFKQHCGSCHAEPLFTTNQFANNGLPIDVNLKDGGRSKITHLAKDSLKFKIPSLRNLAYTKPYMHDGRFKTLEQVLNHYTQGVQQTINVNLTGNISLTSQEKNDLLAFLQTLNDSTFVNDKRFAEKR